MAKSTAKQGVTDGESDTGPLDGVVCCVYKTSQQCIQHLHATFSLALPLMVSLTVTLTLLTSGLLSHVNQAAWYNSGTHGWIQDDEAL